jgi:hypothetical protein
VEEDMSSRILSGGVAAALAGVAMLALTATPSSAFTLSSPSLEKPVASAEIDHVWWDRWGRWHPNRYYYAPHWHCWWNGWGRRVCRWY